MVDEFALMRRLRAEVLEPALSERIFRIGGEPHRWFSHVIFISQGRLVIGADEQAEVLEGPSLAVLPPSPVKRLRLAAGSRGYVLGAAMDVMADAIGDYPETPAIRRFLSHASVFEALDSAQCRSVEGHCQGLIGEVQGQGQPSQMVISAYLRLLLLWAWRHNMPNEQAASLTAGGVTLLQQFRQLVEAEFRQHRPLSDYARQLGISMDRLHAICRRHLNRAPMELLHDRLVQEARIRLERSDRSVREISDGLGFKDPAHFSHFFKGKTGLSPASYRKAVRQTSVPSSARVNVEYHDWP
ncbi:AraC family transcriptional regulator [Rhizobium sp.]|jgi:AraC family transcriptional regulator, transcriptional activator of pobA|uniref:helix-turn-helix domain-containing protein n=1 Tax=Rhizobium sp. TaxID=391 RepID=UPI000E7DE19A|nr:AraC family transcriptional regulator [Rhizobium sp.]